MEYQSKTIINERKSVRVTFIKRQYLSKLNIFYHEGTKRLDIYCWEDIKFEAFDENDNNKNNEKIYFNLSEENPLFEYFYTLLSIQSPLIINNKNGELIIKNNDNKIIIEISSDKNYKYLKYHNLITKESDNVDEQLIANYTELIKENIEEIKNEKVYLKRKEKINKY